MYKTEREVVSAIVRAAKNAGQAALAEARATCPIQTGDLYNSLYTTAFNDGFELWATVPYALDVEEGVSSQVISGTYRTKRKRHNRTSKNGTHKVRAHKVTYNGSRPVQLGNQWATVTAVNAREGTHFMRDACDKAVRESIEQVLQK